MRLHEMFQSQGYHVKDNKVYGKVLAYDGQTVVADHDKAMQLADKFNGSLVKSMDGRRYVIKMSEAPLALVKEVEQAAPEKTAKYDPELARTKKFAQQHYPTLDPDTAFDKLLQRSMQHGEKYDSRQDAEIHGLKQQITALKKEITNVLQQIDMKKGT